MLADEAELKIYDSFTDLDAAEKNEKAFDGEIVTEYRSTSESCMVHISLTDGSRTPYLTGFDYYIADVATDKLKYADGLKIYGHKKASSPSVGDTVASNKVLIREVGAEVH